MNTVVRFLNGVADGKGTRLTQLDVDERVTTNHLRPT